MKSSQFVVRRGLLQRVFLAAMGAAGVVGWAALQGCGAASAPAGSAEPAALDSVRQIAAAVDFRKLLAPPNAKLEQKAANVLEGTVPLNPKQAAQHYLQALGADGWQPGSGPGENLVTDEYAQVQLYKGKWSITFSAIPAGPPGEVRISLRNQGRLDSARLPRIAGAQELYASPLTTSYLTTVPVPEAAEAVVRLLQTAGWQPFGPLNAATETTAQLRMLTLRQQGYEVSVMINVAEAHQNKTAVQYGARTLTHDLPAPADAEEVKFDDDRGQLRCRVPLGLQATVDWYQKALAEAGYAVRSAGNQSGELRESSFVSPDGDVVIASLKASGDAATQVSLRTISAEMVKKLEDYQRKKAEGKTP